MMPLIERVLFVVSGSLALSIVAKVTVIMALAIFAAWLARGSRAAVRHALLAGAFTVTLILPIVSILTRPVRVVVPVMESEAGLPPPIDAINVLRPISATDSDRHENTVIPQTAHPSPASLLLICWMGGTVLFLLPLAIGLWQIHSLRRFGLTWRHGQSLADKLALDAGVPQRVEVLLHEALSGPMTCGFLRPAIVLPQDAENWHGQDLNRALVHELEHVWRFDSTSRSLARFTCAVYWFNPLIWIAWRKLVLEAERSCDDAVLSKSEATDYADQLVGLAKRVALARRSPLLAMANRADLASRISAVLDSQQQRGRAGMFSLAAVAVASLALVTMLSPRVVVAAPQAPSAVGRQPAPRFEVASVKPYRGAPGQITVNADRARFTATGFSLRGLIQFAYEVQSDQIHGGPGWLDSDRFDIQATKGTEVASSQGTAPGKSGSERLMLRALLAERFGLGVHLETRERAVYMLALARGDGKLGPELHKVDVDCTEPESGSKCGSRTSPGKIIGSAQTMPQLTRLLSQLANTGMALDRPIVDGTGLAGVFDINLHFTPDQIPPPPPDAASWGIDPNGPSLFTALREQLGLKLESRKAPVDVLVIDRAERPSEN